MNGPAGPSVYDEEENPVVHDRMRGYSDALKRQRHGYGPENACTTWYIFNQEEGAGIMSRIKDENPGVNAIFCAAGDMAALGIIHQAKSYGIRIPQDISLWVMTILK